MINIDKINFIVSSKLDFDKEIVRKVNIIYWKKIKSRITHLDDTTVSAKGLVNFTVSRYLLYNKIYEIIYKIRFAKSSNAFRDKKKEFILEEYYSYLRKLLNQRNELAILYYEQRKRIFESNSKSIEECRQDSRGVSEQGENEL